MKKLSPLSFEFRVPGFGVQKTSSLLSHPGGNPGENRKSNFNRCHPILVACVWVLTKETIYLPLGCLQGGLARVCSSFSRLSSGRCTQACQGAPQAHGPGQGVAHLRQEPAAPALLPWTGTSPPEHHGGGTRGKDPCRELAGCQLSQNWRPAAAGAARAR